MSTIPLVNAAGGLDFAAAESGKWVEMPHAVCAIEAVMGVAGATTATVEIHGSNRNTTVPGAGTLLGTITLNGAGDAASFVTQAAPYKYKMAKVTALGAGASVSVLVGV